MVREEVTMMNHGHRRRFTREQYHRMGESGILAEADRVELIDGDVVDLSAIKSRHAATVSRIAHLFSTRLGARALVWTQNPLSLTALQSEPMPDLMLLVPRPDFYAAGFPEAASVRLLVEVADTSLFYERQTKLPLYARAGIVEAWVAIPEARRLEIHRNGGRLRYRSVRLPTADEVFAPAAFPDLKLKLRDLFG